MKWKGPRPLKVAILGGPCTGKTTLCKKLDVDYSMAGYRSNVCLEYVRDYIVRYGVPTNIFEQFLLYEGQKRREEALAYCDIIFCDNATILNYVYGLLSCDLQNPKENYALTLLFNWAMKDLSGYEIFYIPREFEVMEDGVRYQDHEAAAVLDSKIKAMLDIMNVPYMVISGDLETRVQTVMNKIGFDPTFRKPVCIPPEAEAAATSE
ncbi:MAG: ATP-binding protein [Candidatus Desulforudis sp.]|nr:ATP-binding protein [Desulforudis sp.]